jgi:hypothetical protein
MTRKDLLYIFVKVTMIKLTAKPMRQHARIDIPSATDTESKTFDGLGMHGVLRGCVWPAG